MKKGFTLIEILVPLALLFIFLSLAFVIFNPKDEFGLVRNVSRWSDLNMLLKATFDYNFSHSGDISLRLSPAPKEICSSAGNCGDLLDLSFLIEKKLLGSIPRDPLCASSCSPNGTGYFISLDKAGHIILSAKLSERGEEIKVSR